MAVPKKKISKARRGMRRAHQALSVVASVECPNCGEQRLSHQMCNACGHYDKREVLAHSNDA